MSPRTRIGIHRTAFVSLCLTPTLLLVGWIAYGAPQRSASVDKSLWEEELSWILGLDVRLEGVEQPQLGRTVLYGVTISDPEWGPMARIRAIELARTEQGVAIVASQPEFQADRLPQLCEIVHDRFLRTRRASDLPVHFLAGEVTLAVESNDPLERPRSMTLTDFDLWIAGGEAGPQLSTEFRLASAPDAQPVQFRVVRKNQLDAPPATWWSFDTRPNSDLEATPLPCWLLSQLIPSLSDLGADCHFAGNCHGEKTAAGWDGKLVGRFHDVDLLQLMAQRRPRGISGRAELELIAELNAGRVVYARGLLDAPGGTIRGDLVDAAIEHLPIKLSPTANRPPGDLWRYRRLAVEFDMNRDGVKLTGWCDTLGDTLLEGETGPLLVREHGAHSPLLDSTRTPVLNLVRALLPPTAAQIPAARDVESLLAVLPLPPPTSSQATVEGEAPSATLRPN
ncbi:MAG: hypothetical protein RIC55_30555 [Pirellulaceae bacterium]